MFTEHSQEPVISQWGYQGALASLPELLRPAVVPQKHRRMPAFLAKPSAVRPRRTDRTEPTLSLREHPEFLKLLTDTKFRQELEAEPQRVLARFGVQLDMKDVPTSVELPPAEEKRNNLLIWLALF